MQFIFTAQSAKEKKKSYDKRSSVCVVRYIPVFVVVGAADQQIPRPGCPCRRRGDCCATDHCASVLGLFFSCLLLLLLFWLLLLLMLVSPLLQRSVNCKPSPQNTIMQRWDAPSTDARPWTCPYCVHILSRLLALMLFSSLGQKAGVQHDLSSE